MATKTTGAPFSLEALDQLLTTYLVGKAPAMPENWKQTLVKFIPWITLILFVITLPIILAFFGISAFLAPISMMAAPGFGFTYSISLIFLAGSLIFEALALPGLFNQSKKSWQLLYYSTLLSGVYNLLSFNIGGLLIGTLLALYILFQIRSYYK